MKVRFVVHCYFKEDPPYAEVLPLYRNDKDHDVVGEYVFIGRRKDLATKDKFFKDVINLDNLDLKEEEFDFVFY